MKPPLFRPAAAADVEDAHRWYESQRAGLGEEFLSAVASGLATVVDHPDVHALVHRDVRRALLRRFPYGLFYRVINDQVVVLACFHAKRDPRKWQQRR